MENRFVKQTKQQNKQMVNSYSEINKEIGKLSSLIERYTGVSNIEIAKNLTNNFERNHSYQKIKQSAKSTMSKLLKLFSKIDDFWVSMDVRLVGKCINEIIESVDKFYLGMSSLKPINLSYTLAKMSEFQKLFKEDSRRSAIFLKEVQERLESSLPKCSQRTETEVEKLTKQYQNLFQLNKLRYGRNTERLNKATVITKHKCPLIEPSAAMHHEIVMKSNVRNCQNEKSSSLSNTTMILLRGGQILAVNKNSNEKYTRTTSKHEKRQLIDDFNIEKELSKKRKRMDEIYQPTEGERRNTDSKKRSNNDPKKKIKIEKKKKITVAEYFVRNRHEHEMKICPVNENAKKRKREANEDYDSKNFSNVFSGVLNAPYSNALKRAKLIAA